VGQIKTDEDEDRRQIVPHLSAPPLERKTSIKMIISFTSTPHTVMLSLSLDAALSPRKNHSGLKNH